MVVLRSVMLSAMLAPRVVVFGPGSLDMRLLTAKLAARAGLDVGGAGGGPTQPRCVAALAAAPALGVGGAGSSPRQPRRAAALAAALARPVSPVKRRDA